MNMNETHTKAQQGADGPSLAGPRSAAQAAAAADRRCRGGPIPARNNTSCSLRTAAPCPRARLDWRPR